MQNQSENHQHNHSFIFILDGLGAPAFAGKITRHIKDELGLFSRCDPAGMWLEIETQDPVTENIANAVCNVVSKFGLLPRDRVGTSFVPSVNIKQLQKRILFEWKGRWATALVFLLPALILHYATPLLSLGSRYIPHSLEALLVGWSIIAALWPVMYQGVLSLRYKIISPDLLGMLIIVILFIIGIIQTVMGANETLFHAVSYAVISISFQRMIIWRKVENLNGQYHRMISSQYFLLFIYFLAVTALIFDYRSSISILLATPLMLSYLAINKLSTPLGTFIPILLFTIFLAISTTFIKEPLLIMQYEAAFIFNICITIIYGLYIGK